LDDTIDAYDPATGRGTGFKFHAYNGQALLDSIRQAISVFRNEPAVWRRIQLNGMAQDFSWQVSAKEYVKLYEAAWNTGIQTIATSSNIPRAKSANMAPVAPIGKGPNGR
jgi:glycogen synthase